MFPVEKRPPDTVLNVPAVKLRRTTALTAGTTVLGWALLAVTLGCLLGRQLIWTSHLLLVATVAVPAATVAALVVALGFGLSRRWIGLGVAAVLFIALATPQAKVALTRAPSAAGHQTVRLMTFNMLLGQANAADIVSEVRRHHTQLLMLQELTPQAITRLEAAGIGRVFGSSYLEPADGGGGVGLFSVYPLTDRVDHPGFTLKVISATVTLGDNRTFTAYSSHLSAPWPQSAWEWQAEAGRLGAALAKTPGLVVDAGDFNATTDFRTFRDLVSSGRMTDGAAQAGAATLRTYPANRAFPPLIGIDHVLVRGLRATGVHAVHLAGSDHRAVLATLLLP